MSTPVVKAAVLAVTGTLAALLLQRGAREIALPLAAVVCVLILHTAVEMLRPVLELLERARSLTGLSAAYFSPLLKCVGIAFLSRAAADLCKDGGQGAVASAVELAGVLGALFAALPLFAALLDMVEELV